MTEQEKKYDTGKVAEKTGQELNEKDTEPTNRNREHMSEIGGEDKDAEMTDDDVE